MKRLADDWKSLFPAIVYLAGSSARMNMKKIPMQQ